VNTLLFYTFTRHVGTLNRCFMSAKPKAMQEIRDNTSVVPRLDLPNGLMRSYLIVPTYLMVFFWKLSPYLGWLKGGTFHPCLFYLASF
jgi:hypothetical protein